MNVSLIYFCIYVGSKKVDGSISSSRIVYGMDGDVVASDGSSEYPLSHKILAFVLTTALMVWYGYKNQIVRLPRSNPGTVGQDEEDDEYWE